MRSEVILATRLSPLRDTKETHHGQRSPVHILIHEEPLPSPRDKAKHFVSIPPADGRTIRTKKSTFKLLMGSEPRTTWEEKKTTVQAVTDRLQDIQHARSRAQDCIKHAQ